MTTISTLTAIGIFMHDGHFDKAMVTTTEAPIDAAHISRTGHTHADYNLSNSLLNNSFAYQSPAVPPKSRSERKHRLQLPGELGHHAFDDVLMPIVA